MEPISAIIASAIAAGAAEALKPVAEQGVKDAYNGLKKLISDLYGHKKELMTAVETVVEKPDDEDSVAALENELKNAGATEDTQLIEAANAVHINRGSQQARKRSLGRRLDIRLKQVEALEDQLALEMDAGDKVLLEEKTERLWSEIAALEEQLLALG